MRSLREEEFFNAIKTIQTALSEGVVRLGWDKKDKVSQIMIHSGAFGATFLADREDRECGYLMNNGLALGIIDQAELERRERDKAQTVLNEAMRKQTALNKEVEDAHAKLQDANRRLSQATKT